MNTPLSGTAQPALDQKTLKGRERRWDRWAVRGAGLLTVVVMVGLFAWSQLVLKERAGGDTIAGYILGVIAAGTYLVVSAYAVRRRRRRQSLLQMRVWMQIHLIFGAVAGLAAILHSGVQLGAPIHGGFLIAFLLLVGTGILGKYLYTVVPKRLTLLEEEGLLLEDVVERQQAGRIEIDQLTDGVSAELQELVDNTIPKAIKTPMHYAKRRMRWDDVRAEVYAAIGGDTAVGDQHRELVKRAVDVLVEDRYLSAQLRYHRLLSVWLPTHVGLTSLCIPWLIFHVVTALVL